MSRKASKTIDEIIREDARKYIYGCAYSDDFLLRNPQSLPRYGHLARKLILHYVGDCYNPNVDGLIHEPYLRTIIKDIVSYKVLYKTLDYDWEWIDHFFRRYFNGCFNLNLPVDETKIDRDFLPHCKAAALVNRQSIN